MIINPGLRVYRDRHTFDGLGDDLGPVLVQQAVCIVLTAMAERAVVVTLDVVFEVGRVSCRRRRRSPQSRGCPLR